MRGFTVLLSLFYSFWFPPTLLHTAAATHARERAASTPLGRATSAVALARASRHRVRFSINSIHQNVKSE
eukprot:6213262-Pleurochrysis_carterae.AAC.2